MKKFWNKKNVLLLLGFVLLVAMPFLIISKKTLPMLKDSPLNPYPEPRDIAASHVQKASENYFYREFPQAANNYRKAIAIYEDRKDTHHVATTYNSLADLYVWAGDLEEAEKNYLLASQHHANIDDLLGQADSLKELADMHMKKDHFKDAEKWYSQSLGILKNGKPNRVLGSVHEGMGHLYWKSNRIPKAIDSFTQAQETYGALNYNLGAEHMTSVLNRLRKIPNTQRPHSLRGTSPPEGYAVH